LSIWYILFMNCWFCDLPIPGFQQPFIRE
jgi:hypothetical protein